MAEVVEELRNWALSLQRMGYGDGAEPYNAAAPMLKAAAEITRLERALERLASPLAFDVSKVADIESHARMIFAQRILDGKTIEQATELAYARVHKADAELLKRQLSPEPPQE